MAVSNWTTQQVAIWLKQQGFSNSYADLFCKKHKIDGKALLTLTEHDLKEPPLEITILGDIKRLSLAIRKLQSDNRDDIHQFNFENGDAQKSSNHAGSSRRRVLRMDSESSTISDTDYERDYPGRGDHRSASAAGSSSGRPRLPPEYAKLLLSYLYMFAVFIITAFVMVMANDRVPDTNKYPPLPDLVLDNMPYVPWAFDMCEMCALVLSLILMVTLMFHKHRFIIMRRLFALTGTVFLLRSITMLITSLSVPGVHLDCQPQPGSSLWSKAERAFVIWRGAGMSLQGVRTCGDYMFSGHTVTVTTLNFFITEYTPRRMYWLHTATWVMNMFGIFFILAAHEHYSIDVFIAFYITSRLFLYYHTLANNKALTQGDRKRTRIWFPMFSYFEANVDGMVPNEYEWPISTFINWVKKNNWFGIIGAIGGRK